MVVPEHVAGTEVVSHKARQGVGVVDPECHDADLCAVYHRWWMMMKGAVVGDSKSQFLFVLTFSALTEGKKWFDLLGPKVATFDS